MLEMIFPELLHALAPYKLLILMIGSIYPGEETIILFSVFAGQGLIPLSHVIVIGTIGVILVDHIIFWLSKSHFAFRIKRWRIFSKRSQRLSILLHKLHKERPFLMLFITKFIYGLRYISIFYVGRKMQWNKFFIYDLGAFALWGAIMIPLAWFAAKGAGKNRVFYKRAT
jgi:membrane protein DedA with SNARE-associated domain